MGFLADELTAKDFFRLISTMFRDRKERTYSGVQKGYYKTGKEHFDKHVEDIMTHFSSVFEG